MNDSILTRIYAARRESVARAERETPTGALQRLASELPPARNFARALRQPPYGLIAEVKKGSPSRGMFRDDLDPAALAAQYVAGGAAAISVVTEPEFFFGALGWIGAIRREVELPILRKDFLFCEYQIWESRAAGADAVLLILAMLDDADADRLLGVAQDAGLQCLVEVHNEAEAQRACDLGASLVGVNNRDLKTFEVSGRRESRREWHLYPGQLRPSGGRRLSRLPGGRGAGDSR